MGHLPIGVNAIGGHPMTGKENSGIEESDANSLSVTARLYCARQGVQPRQHDCGHWVIDSNGCRQSRLKWMRVRHDQIVAGISHLPYLLSATLVATIANQAKIRYSVLGIGSGGLP